MPMRRTRLLAHTAAIALLLATPAVLLAHAPLESSDPEAGANLEEPPGEVVMTFAGELDPDGSGFVVTDADGVEIGAGEVDLDVAERNVIRGEITVDAPGVYTVTWTSVAPDGHAESGEFSFGYRADPGTAGSTSGSVGADEQTPPNSAVAPLAGPRPSVMLGVLLLGLATLAGSRAVALRVRSR